MQETPKRIDKYLEFDLKHGGMILKEEAPLEIKKEAIAWEREFYSKTGRRRIVNLDIDEASVEFVFDNKNNLN